MVVLLFLSPPDLTMWTREVWVEVGCVQGIRDCSWMVLFTRGEGVNQTYINRAEQLATVFILEVYTHYNDMKSVCPSCLLSGWGCSFGCVANVVWMDGDMDCVVSETVQKVSQFSCYRLSEVKPDRRSSTVRRKSDICVVTDLKHIIWNVFIWKTSF